MICRTHRRTNAQTHKRTAIPLRWLTVSRANALRTAGTGTSQNLQRPRQINIGTQNQLQFTRCDWSRNKGVSIIGSSTIDSDLCNRDPSNVGNRIQSLKYSFSSMMNWELIQRFIDFEWKKGKETIVSASVFFLIGISVISVLPSTALTGFWRGMTASFLVLYDRVCNKHIIRTKLPRKRRRAYVRLRKDGAGGCVALAKNMRERGTKCGMWDVVWGHEDVHMRQGQVMSWAWVQFRRTELLGDVERVQSA